MRIAIGIVVSGLMFTASAQNRGGAVGGHFGRGGFSGGNMPTPPPGSIIHPGVPSSVNLGNAWRGYSNMYRGNSGRIYGRRYGSGYGGVAVLAYPIYVGGSPYDYGYLPEGYTPPPPGYYDD